MNLDQIKKRLEQMNRPSSYSKDETKNLFWKPSIGKQVIRIVPSKFNSDMPFTEMKFYYGIGEKKTMASPTNWGKPDPIMEFTKKLRQSNDKENWRLAKKLDPKVRIFAPVIVRGEEHEGVKLWQFGKKIYESFLQMAADEEIGDYTDILQGRDIKLTTVGPEATGTRYNETTISPSLKVSPLATTEEEINRFKEEQVDPMKLFKPLEFEEMKQALQEWLSPEEEEDEISSEPEEPFDDEKDTISKSNYSLNQKAKPKSKSEQFEDLFSEEDNDLPF